MSGFAKLSAMGGNNGAEDWKGHERRDGARVRLISRGKWLVPVGGPVWEAITDCPCCGQSFETMTQA